MCPDSLAAPQHASVYLDGNHDGSVRSPVMDGHAVLVEHGINVMASGQFAMVFGRRGPREMACEWTWTMEMSYVAGGKHMAWTI